MRLFRRRKKERKEQQKTLPQWLIKATNAIHNKWAQQMQRLTSGLTRRGWIVILAVIIVTGNGYGIYKVLSAFDRPAKSVSTGRIKLPLDSSRTGKPSFSTIPKGGVEVERIMQFKRYMDSLARSPTGRVTYDSIISRRPGLMDSLQLIEHYYSPTNK